VTDKHLLDGKLAAHILMPPESTFPLHLVATDKRLLDEELAPQFMMFQMLDHPQGKLALPDNHRSEVFVRFKVEDQSTHNQLIGQLLVKSSVVACFPMAGFSSRTLNNEGVR
jgi:hypothetical protein